MQNWKYKGKEFKVTPDEYEGFIYRINNLSNGMFYIGRKSFFAYRKKRLTAKDKLIVENKRKTFRIDKTKTPWEKYTGSCKVLNDDIKKGHKIDKQIIHLCKSRKNMTAWELKEILCSGGLESDNCYNSNVLGKIFKKDFEK